MTLLSSDETPFFYYGQDVVSDDESRTFLDFLATVPIRPVDQCDPTREFAFVTHHGIGVGTGRSRGGGPSRSGSATTGVPV
jgi:hypothetical protein